ncbi:F-box domain-containing protein [Dioscorea alata]|uniref:F-box domain-containing protein n=1 Tax=Dioscorea alata TaxID=55571 RepID=A0ACB7UE36_DIOAL|nr:F-box domain-containing protein [Dioscorea alata]
MNDHHRNWSSLPWSAINYTARLLNAVDDIRFRSVCWKWRRYTHERQKAPLLILITHFKKKQDDTDTINDLSFFDIFHKHNRTIKSLSFFDIIRKEIIPIPLLAFSRVKKSYYLGSSIGTIIVGQYTPAQTGNQEKLMITIFNPFIDHYIINLPSLTSRPGGRAFVSVNDNVTTVVYYVAGRVYFINSPSEDEWESFLFYDRPDDIVSCNRRIYACVKGVLYEIDLKKREPVHSQSLLPGLLPCQFFDVALPLRSFEDIYGKLHLLCTSNHRTNLYCFIKARIIPRGRLEVPLFQPPSRLLLIHECLVISDDLCVESRNEQHGVHVDDYHPYPLLLKLSSFWNNNNNNGQNRWKLVGWITPCLSPEN